MTRRDGLLIGFSLAGCLLLASGCGLPGDDRPISSAQVRNETTVHLSLADESGLEELEEGRTIRVLPPAGPGESLRLELPWPDPTPAVGEAWCFEGPFFILEIRDWQGNPARSTFIEVAAGDVSLFRTLDVMCLTGGNGGSFVVR